VCGTGASTQGSSRPPTSELPPPGFLDRRDAPGPLLVPRFRAACALRGRFPGLRAWRGRKIFANPVALSCPSRSLGNRHAFVARVRPRTALSGLSVPSVSRPGKSMSVTSVPWQGTPDAFGRNHRRARSVASRVSRQGSTRMFSVTYGIAVTARIPLSPPRRPAAGRIDRTRSSARQAHPLRPPRHRGPTARHELVPPVPTASRALCLPCLNPPFP
jgi:hypothetical protein